MSGIVDLVEGGPPFARNQRAAVVVEGAEPDELELSFFDQGSERYIGRAGWTGEPTFHRARRVGLSKGRTGYEVGPEVTSRLRLDAAFRIASRDGALEGVVASRVATYHAATGGSGIAFDAPGAAPPPTPPPAPPPRPKPRDPRPAAAKAAPPPPPPPPPMPEPPPPVPPVIAPAAVPPARRPRRLLVVLLLLLGIAATAATLLFYGPLAWRLQACGLFPQLALCQEASELAAMEAAGRRTPCESGGIERWIREHPDSPVLPQAREVQAGMRATCRSRMAEAELRRGRACQFSDSCRTTCFATLRRDFPGTPQIAEATAAEAEGAAICADRGTMALFQQGRECRARNVCRQDCFAELKRRQPNWPRMSEVIRIEQEADETCAVNQLFEQGRSCLRATPCATTCFDALKARYPSSPRLPEARMLEERANDSPLCRRPPPPPTPPPPPPEPAVTTCVIAGLYDSGVGDDWLALRSEPVKRDGNYSVAFSSRYMRNGTRLVVFGRSGEFYHVRLLTGQEGWASSTRIVCS